LQTIGTVQPSSTVSVKSLVDGEIIGSRVSARDFVKKGQLLFQIDPRPYQASLQEAQANLAKDQAQYDNAKSQLQEMKIWLKKAMWLPPPWTN